MPSPNPRFVRLLVTLLLCGLTAQLQAQDASALEAQYKTCTKHYIPADKCTSEIYQQLKAKDNAPLDSTAATALKAVTECQTRMKNPNSIQVRTVFVTDEGAICLEIGSQNGAGGMSVSRVVYITSDSKGAKRLRKHWLDESGMGGSASADVERMRGSGYEVDRWDHVCIKSKNLLTGKDVSEKIKEAVKDSK